VTRHQYVISAVLPQTSFRREGSGGVAKQSIKFEIKCLIELLPSHFCLYRTTDRGAIRRNTNLSPVQACKSFIVSSKFWVAPYGLATFNYLLVLQICFWFPQSSLLHLRTIWASWKGLPLRTSSSTHHLLPCTTLCCFSEKGKLDNQIRDIFLTLGGVAFLLVTFRPSTNVELNQSDSIHFHNIQCSTVEIPMWATRSYSGYH